ncbi:MAG: hypothetical protein WC619_03265 [Patescibacteria group bacterium]
MGAIGILEPEDARDIYFYRGDEEDGEEESGASPSKILHNIYLAIIVIAILAITAVLYFGLDYLYSEKTWAFLEQLRFAIPALAPIAGGGVFYFYFLRDRWAEEIVEKIEEETVEEAERELIEYIPVIIAHALASSRKLEVTFKREAETTIGIRLLVIMAKMEEIELGDGNVCKPTLEKFADERKWPTEGDRTVKIILTERFSCGDCRNNEKFNSNRLKEYLMGNVEEIRVVE